MLVFFIGGPWNNRLQEMGECPSRGCYRAIWPLPANCLHSVEPISPAFTRHAEYYPDTPLPTGVPVYTCLWPRTPRRLSDAPWDRLPLGKGKDQPSA